MPFWIWTEFASKTSKEFSPITRHLAGSPVQGLRSILVSFVRKPGGKKGSHTIGETWHGSKLTQQFASQPIPRVTGGLFDFATSALPFRSQSSADYDRSGRSTNMVSTTNPPNLSGLKIDNPLGFGASHAFLGTPPRSTSLLLQSPLFIFFLLPAAFLAGSWSSARPQT